MEYRFYIFSFTNAIKKGILNTSSIMKGDLDRTETDLTLFNEMEILFETSFKSNPLDSCLSNFLKESNNISNISNKTSKSNSF